MTFSPTSRLEPRLAAPHRDFPKPLSTRGNRAHVLQRQAPSGPATAGGVGILFDIERDIDAIARGHLRGAGREVPCLRGQTTAVLAQVDAQMLLLQHTRRTGALRALHHEQRRWVSEAEG